MSEGLYFNHSLNRNKTKIGSFLFSTFEIDFGIEKNQLQKADMDNKTAHCSIPHWRKFIDKLLEKNVTNK